MFYVPISISMIVHAERNNYNNIIKVTCPWNWRMRALTLLRQEVAYCAAANLRH